jgi:prophage antirepressor-like protein
LGYTNTAESLNELDVDDTKTLCELLVVSLNPDIFISVYGLSCLVWRSKKQYAAEFRRWVSTDIIMVMRRKANCSNDDEESTCYEDSMVERDEDQEEEWHDFSINTDPKYWLRKMMNKTALMKECDKRGVIIDNPMMTLNVKIIEALIAADTI